LYEAHGLHLVAAAIRDRHYYFSRRVNNAPELINRMIWIGNVFKDFSEENYIIFFTH